MRENCAVGPHARDLVQIEIDEAILEIRDGLEVAGGIGQVQRIAAMAGPFGDAHRGGAHGAERLVGGVHQHGMGVDAAGGLEFHQVGLEQDAAAADVAQVLRQQAAHRVVDGLVVGRRLEDGNARRRNRAAARTPHPAITAAPAVAVSSSRLVSWCAMHQPQKKSVPFCVPATSMSSDVSGSVRQASGPAGSSRRAGGRAPSARCAASSARRRNGIRARKRSATFSARSVSRRAHAAQGGQRHAGGLGIRRRFIAECAHRTVIPAAALAHAPQQEAAALIDAPPDRRRWAGGALPFPAPEWPARSVQPTPPSRESRAIPEIRARAVAASPRSHMRKRYVSEDSSPLVPSSQSMARAGSALPSCSGGTRATSAVTQVLSSNPVCGGQPPSGNCAARSHCEAAARRLEFAGGQQSQDGVDRRLRPGSSPDVGPTAIPILFAHHKLDRHCKIAAGDKPPNCALCASHHYMEHSAHGRRLRRRRESSMTSVTPAPSQIAPCIARSISFLLSWFGFRLISVTGCSCETGAVSGRAS